MSQRAVIGRPANVRFVIEDDTGTVLTADTPPPVTIKDLDDATVISGTATAPVSPDIHYSYGFTRNTLGEVTASWTAEVGGLDYTGTEVVRFVSRRAVPLHKLKQDPVLGALSTLDFLDAVGGAENALETALRFRIVTTMDRITVQITRPQRVLRLGPHYIQRVAAATRDGVAIDPALISVVEDALELPSAGSWDFLTGGATTGTWQPGLYTFDIVHGLVETPADVQNAVKLLARNHSATTQDAYPDRATKVVSAETEIWFGRRSSDTYFGIPEVDDVVVAMRLDLPLADNQSY